jgi:hypothetical protein
LISNLSDKSPMFYARLAAVLYLVMVPLGFVGIIYVPSTLIVDGDPVKTVANIIESESMFRIGILAALLIPVVNTALVFTLYRILRPANKLLAQAMVVLILLAVPIAMFNEINNAHVLQLVSGADYLDVFDTEQINAQVMSALDLHESGIFIASLFWGLWLLPMGYAIVISGYIPKVLGYLLLIGGIGYVLDAFIYFLVPDANFEMSTYTFIGELLLPLWLLIKGVNVERWIEADKSSS